MRALGYGFLGLTAGTAAGFWFGLMSGLIYADFARITCFEGRCGAVAIGIGAMGAVLGGVAGTGLGLRRAGAGREGEAGFSGRSSIHSIV